jgi:ATP-grasp domain
MAPQAQVTGVSVQEMVGDGVEVIIGVSCDPQLGPVLVFGSGGVMVEVYNDVALRRCPITRSEAQAMIAEVNEPGCSRAFADGQRRTSRRSRIPWCACPTSPCTLKDTWQSWTSIH